VWLLVSLVYINMDLPLDPSECIGTPEYEEVYEEQRARCQALIDLIEEQDDYDTLQFPYRQSN